MNILIADDHAIVRKGLGLLLREEFIAAQITEASNSSEVYKLVKGRIWDFILLDISMPGSSGVDILKQLRAEGITAPILMLSMHPEEQYAIRVLKAGASGFLNKNSATDELINAVRKVLSGGKYITPSLAEQLAANIGNPDKMGHELLSDREMQIFQLLAVGKSVSDIADDIKLGVSTVSTYRGRILEKLRLNNNAEITRYALDNGLVQ
jgi:two-component system, NarL family, invasion response regulator UvrY